MRRNAKKKIIGPTKKGITKNHEMCMLFYIFNTLDTLL